MLIKKANVFFMPFNKCVQTGINSGTNNRKANMLDKIFELLEEVIVLNNKLSEDEKLHQDFTDDIQKYLDGNY